MPPPSPLDYASPRPEHEAGGLPGAGLLTAAVSVAGAVLGANALAEAAGFSPAAAGRANPDAAFVLSRIFCGLLAGLLSVGFVRFVVLQGRAVSHAVARSRRVPDRTTVFVLLGCGAACIIAAGVVQLLAGRASAAHSVTVQPYGGVAVTVQPPLITQVIALLTFVAGAALAALGVACSFMRGEPTDRTAPPTSDPSAASASARPAR